MDGEERALFARSVADALGAVDGRLAPFTPAFGAPGGPTVEPDRHAAPGAAARQVLDALDAVGFADALSADRPAAVAIVFDVLGRTGLPMLDALGRLLADGIDGRGDRLALVLPPLGTAGPSGRRRGDAVAVAGLVGPGVAADGDLGVVVDGDAGVEVLAVPADRLERRPVHGMDPALGVCLVGGTVAAGPMAAVGPSGHQAAPRWDEAVAVGRLAAAHTLLGAARTMLELARTHALDRVQFGRPIAGFQAVRHRLADTLVAIEGAEALADAAWSDGGPTLAISAKAAAGDAARVAARHCQQVLAGIGFTAEHPFHRYLRRIAVVDQLLGSAAALTRALGAAVLASGKVDELAL